MQKLIWSRLKNNKCPKCSGMIEKARPKANAHFVYVCEYSKTGDCDFSITQERFDSLLKDLYKPRSYPNRSPEDNLSALNNL